MASAYNYPHARTYANINHGKQQLIEFVIKIHILNLIRRRKHRGKMSDTHKIISDLTTIK